MKDPILLSKVQDQVWADPQWKATIDPVTKIETTHCNQGALAVANGVGCHEFDPPAHGDPYTADQLFNFFQRSTSNFLEKNLEDCHELVQKGSLVYAVCASWILQEAHGHIVSLTPGDAVKSGSLNIWVPACMNIGTVKLSARLIGINLAFPMRRAMPRFFAWRGSL